MSAIDEALVLANQFHTIYERLAPSFGYETRTETRLFSPSTPNGKLMVAVCAEIIEDGYIAQLHNQIKELEAVVHGAHNKISNYTPDASDSLELLQELQVLCKSTNPPEETE
jgi:hypothetical protein